MEIPWDYILRMVFAFVAGCALGLEREYRDKPAGLRTIILITVGAALFSLLNFTIDSQSRDRIASTVVTGVGFVGGGVIFKEGVNVRGVTTAATIWVAAAIGMAMGFGNYWLAFTTLLLTLMVLTVLSKAEKFLDSKYYQRDFKFSFRHEEYSLDELEKEFKTREIKFQRFCLTKNKNELTVQYKLRCSKEQCHSFFTFLMNNNQLSYFQEAL
jgi:putative Mg2+ transporter-C (MgtC) family protein